MTPFHKSGAGQAQEHIAKSSKVKCEDQIFLQKKNSFLSLWLMTFFVPELTKMI